MLAFAVFVAWPASTDTDVTFVGQLMFEEFTDPIAAASMKIVTFDEERGQLQSFEVRKNAESGLWTIPSRDGYPADGFTQMRDAANALVGLKILDTQTSNAEDHDDLGVSEPKLEDLEVGDEGVGRLVSFKDESQETLASLIIGDTVSDDPAKRYVRVPGQDPVYVVKLDESPLTTKFQDWIEDDLLQLSSIDITDMEIKDYSAAISATGQFELTRNYAATVKVDRSQWILDSLVEYDPKNPLADPTPVEPGEDDRLNKGKLDALKNALDDLKIADVVRKPDGMSANLRAKQDLLADKDAVGSLAQRGFYPIPTGPSGEMEIISANGELAVALQSGVKYIMRFGNIAGVTESEDEDAGRGEVEAGVNRYLLVTTMVDQSKFPVPLLRPVPQSLEDLDAILNPEKNSTSGQGETTGAGEAQQPADKDGLAEEDGQDAAAQDETPDDEKLTEEELLERLEAEQEKITKENQRKLDARKDKLEIAERQVRALNSRFADWYYVIPEGTYSQLRIKRDQLFEQPPSATGSVNVPLDAVPQFRAPGVPGN
jgi:hypothetical protein